MADVERYRHLRDHGALAIEAWSIMNGRPTPERLRVHLARCLRRSRRNVVRQIDAPDYRWMYGPS